jgi:hypothetical protein
LPGFGEKSMANDAECAQPAQMYEYANDAKRANAAAAI